ncbi:sugar transferase [Flagellimonas sp. HMM57]|uniref:sugar transferase n=1 Tax=unclassified Flagellimonas TaxID=2644544 RepID=UPI0013D56A22|nr:MULTISPECIES: sugar transferase [unclassified Flagellimonas]UII76146.1 sugar transferase [Flagellimonas sp. HMM57]
MYKYFLKRVIDFVFSFFGLLILSPIFLVVTLLLFFANKGTPFFVQDRPGKNGKIFYVLKFKTMNDDKDSMGELLPDKDRITKIGKFVRKTSLDEIPQLWNVLKGDMSLIGPRPLRTFYLPFYSLKEQRRHNVRPGITGLAQVSGRNFLKWEQRFAYDLEYIEKLSFWLDAKIIYKTFLKVIKSSDVATDPDEFVESFHIYRQQQIDSGIFEHEQQ